MTHIVYPEANKYVVPDKKKAELVIGNNLTEKEDEVYGEKISTKEQLKESLNKVQLNTLRHKILREYPQEPKCTKQEDVYVADNESNGNRLLRIRVEDGQLKSLQYQGNPITPGNGIVTRPFMTLCEDPFVFPYTDGENPMYPGCKSGYEKLVYDLKNSGFHITNIISKNRAEYLVGDVSLNLDDVSGLGLFAEARTVGKSGSDDVESLVSRFGVKFDPKRTKVDSYYDLNNERNLNEGITEIDVAGAYTEIKKSDEINESFNKLRAGYPDKPYKEQTHGYEFREASNSIINALVKDTLDIIGEENSNKVVVALPWRSALAFAEPYSEAGAEFYHLSSKRNEVTLETEVSYSSGEVSSDSFVVIADPMLATGNTMLDTIERIKGKGVPEGQIILNSIVAAPIGIYKVLLEYPEVRIIVGSLDEKLNKFGYIVPGLGDFGDKYFDNINAEQYVGTLVSKSIMTQEAGDILLKRMRSQQTEDAVEFDEQRITDEPAEPLQPKAPNQEDKEGSPIYAMLSGHFSRHPEYSAQNIQEIIQDVEQHIGHELERKYVVAKEAILPYIYNKESKSILQSYFPPQNWNEVMRISGLDVSDWQENVEEMRIRQKGREYIVTAKSKKTPEGNRLEKEITVSGSEIVKQLFELATGGTVIKERTVVPVEVDGISLNAEVDYYQKLGENDGVNVEDYPYTTVEIELPGSFLVPILNDHLSEYAPFLTSATDVTNDHAYNNKALATNGFPRIKL